MNRNNANMMSNHHLDYSERRLTRMHSRTYSDSSILSSDSLNSINTEQSSNSTASSSFTSPGRTSSSSPLQACLPMLVEEFNHMSMNQNNNEDNNNLNNVRKKSEQQQKKKKTHRRSQYCFVG